MAMEVRRSPKSRHGIASAQLSLDKLPGTPQDPPHALCHVFHLLQSSQAWIWSCSTFLGCTVSGAAQPLPAMLSSFTNITNNSRPYFPRVWISFPSSWHYCFLMEQFLPRLGSFLQCIQSCLDEMKMLDITREAQGSWIIQTPCKELGGC